MTEALPILATNLAISAAFFAALWLISIRLKDPSFIDSWWALGVIVLSWSTYAQLDAPGPHATALMFLSTAWAVRLGVYLLWRWGKHGRDRRYEKLAERARVKHKLNFAMFALLWVFAPQLLLQFVMALPAMLGQVPATQALSGLGYAGLWLAIIGILYEAIADAQLAHFKSQSENDGKVMDRGLWRYSRHPNYFAEMVAWWGMWLIALDAGMGLWSIAGPLLLTYLLTRVSGAPTTEPHLARTKPDYEAYKKRTSAFIPLPPNKT
jgi:steroid 5-alpha reductase family enzyme